MSSVMLYKQTGSDWIISKLNFRYYFKQYLISEMNENILIDVYDLYLVIHFYVDIYIINTNLKFCGDELYQIKF